MLGSSATTVDSVERVQARRTQKKFGSAADATAAQQQMSLVRQVADQQAGVAVGTAGQQMGNFKAVSAAVEAAETKGPSSKERRPEATGSRGGSHSGGTGRGAVMTGCREK